MIQNNNLTGEILCTKCGLCCTDVFHDYVSLKTDEENRVFKKSNIHIELNKAKNQYRVMMPCPALINSICSIYSERPSVCREHECNLLKSVNRGDITIEDGLNVVKKMHDILNDVLHEFKDLIKNNTSKSPIKLMDYALENLGGESSVRKFKKDNTTLFLKYGIFIFLTHNYFYKKNQIPIQQL